MITEKMVKVIMKTIVNIVAITGLVILEIKAMEIGIDGAIFGTVIAAISGITGFTIRDIFRKEI